MFFLDGGCLKMYRLCLGVTLTPSWSSKFFTMYATIIVHSSNTFRGETGPNHNIWQIVMIWEWKMHSYCSASYLNWQIFFSRVTKSQPLLNSHQPKNVITHKCYNSFILFSRSSMRETKCSDSTRILWFKRRFPSTAWKTQSSHEMILSLSSFYTEYLNRKKYSL